MSVKPMAGFDMDQRDPNNLNEHLQVPPFSFYLYWFPANWYWALVGDVGRYYWRTRRYQEYTVRLELFLQMLQGNEKLLLHSAHYLICPLPGLLFRHQLCLSGFSGL